MIESLMDVDKAFKEALMGLKVEDADGNLVDVPVCYINPESQFEVMKYPVFVIYRSGAYPDPARYSNDTYRVSTEYYSNGNPKSAQDIKNPEPYKIYYNVRLYYNYQVDGLSMNSYLMRKFKRGAYLEICGDKYDIDMVSYKNPNSTYREFGDIKENKEREFVDQYLYSIDINIFDGQFINRQFMKPIEEGGGLVIRLGIEHGETHEVLYDSSHTKIIDEEEAGNESNSNE